MNVVIIDNNISENNLDQATLALANINLKFLDQMENIYQWSVENKPNALVVAIDLEPIDGISLCKEIKAHPLTDEIIFILTSKNEDNYLKTIALTAGADAFLKTPLDTGLLKATLLSINRRVKKEHHNIASENDPVISLERHLVFYKGNEIMLPRKQFDIFALLFNNKGIVLSREIIISKVWGDKKSDVNPRTIDVHIRNIRDKIGEQFIQTIKGVGYKFKTNAVVK